MKEFFIMHISLRQITLGLLMTAALPAMAQSVAVIVNPKNAAPPSGDQIANIYLGKSADLVGVDLPDGSAARDAFYQKATGKDGAQVKAYWAKLVFTGKAQPLKELGSDAEVKKFVASTPNAIGYIDKSAADGSVKVIASY
jgi:ABC-type phosphate transport system substrate-binding protein